MKKFFLIVALLLLLVSVVAAAPLEKNRCYAVVDARQGVSETDWALPGTTNFEPHGDLVQVGSFVWSGAAANNGRFLVTFPQSYGGGNTPVVFVQVVGAYSEQVLATSSPLFSGFYVDWETADNSTMGSVQVFWMAVGRDPACQ